MSPGSATAPSSAADLSPLDWIKFTLSLPIFLLRFFYSLFLKPHPALHWRQKIALSFLRSQRASLPTSILRWSVRRISTGTAITTYCAKQQIPHEKISIPHDASIYDSNPPIPPAVLHILTPPSHDDLPGGPTLLYFHGGGYVNPLRSAAHMPFILSCARSTKIPCSRVIILEYSLAPEHKYPAQIVQALAATRYLLEEMGLPARDIILAGDSAGGQLVGAILAHLAKPCPYFPAFGLAERDTLRAAVMISPLVKTPARKEGGSYIFNDGQDYLTWNQVEEFKEAWGAKDGDLWANLCGVEEERGVWTGVFHGIERVVERCLVVVGTAEVFLDDVREWSEEGVKVDGVVRVRRGEGVDGLGERLVLVECEGEAHVQVALDCVVGFDEGGMTRAVRRWLEGV